MIVLPNNSVEMICVLLTIDGIRYFIFNVYLPPGIGVAKYKTALENIDSVMSTSSPSDKFIITGDFNLGDIVWLASQDDDLHFLVPTNMTREEDFLFVDTISSMSLFQVSAVVNPMNRALDLVLSDSPNDIEFMQCDPISKLDILHPPLLFSFAYKILPPKNQPNQRIFNFKKCNFVDLNAYLSNVDWSSVTSATDIDSIVTEFYKILFHAFDLFVPTVSRKFDSTHAWFTSDLRKLKNRKNYLHKKLKRKYDAEIHSEYCIVKKRLLAETNVAYNNYISTLKQSFKKDPKQFWSYIDSKRKVKGFPKVMEFEDQSSDSNDGICELFASFFEGVYKTDNCQKNPEYTNINRFNITIDLPIVSPDDISSIADNLKNSCSPGPDDVPPIILKYCSNSLKNILSFIFNKSLQLQRFPSIWKISNIIPLFQKGARQKISNYRGIAKISALPKLFEAIVTKDLSFKVKQLISPLQHGFVPGRSTITNLLSFTTKVNQVLRCNKQVDVGFFDFSKTFDQLNHRILIEKLGYYGFSSTCIEWIRQYLSGRFQSVIFNESQSRLFHTPSGVPQGSHLGPLLFILFINDLPNAINNSEVLLYADDAKVFKSIDNNIDNEQLQADFDNLSLWCYNNDLSINIQKCCILTISRKKKT